MTKRIIAIGGGEIKDKTTLKIDEYVANLAKEHAGDKRANIVFIGTASYDAFPYFNSVRKTYTSVFDIKTEIMLLIQRPQTFEDIKQKLLNADALYVGGGNTEFMMRKWKESGVYDLIIDAYERGVPVAGLSAGAICWFKKLYSDFEIMQKLSNDYKFLDGFGIIDGAITPHYNHRTEFDGVFLKEGLSSAYALEDNSAVVFADGKFEKSLTSGGNAYYLTQINGVIKKEKL